MVLVSIRWANIGHAVAWTTVDGKWGRHRLEVAGGVDGAESRREPPMAGPGQRGVTC